jgi:hypothetical protein
MPYDDNFGNWELDGEDRDETMSFYRHCQNNSVEKVCSICGRHVMLMAQYDKCDACCRRIENGY